MHRIRKNKKKYNNDQWKLLRVQLVSIFRMNASKILMIVILVAGFIFRIYPAITRWFWEDELATYAFALAPYPWIEQLIRPMDDRPPLFYLFIRFMIKFTKQETMLRLPIILSSFMSCLIIYKSIQRYSKKAALIVLYLLLFSVFRIEYSWQLRDYGLLMLPTSIIFYLFSEYVTKLIKTNTISRPHLVGISVSAFIGCLINYIFVIYVVCKLLLIVIITLFYRYKHIKKIDWSFIPKLAIVQIPLIGTLSYYLLRQFSIIRATTGWIPEVSVYSYFLINAVFLGLSNNIYDLYSTNTALLPDYVIITIAISIFFGLCIFLLEKKKSVIDPTLRILFYSGLFIYVTGQILVFFCSWILGTDIFLIRTFLRIGTMYLISFGLGIYIIINALIRPKYVRTTIVFLSLIYFCIFLRFYIDWYAPSQKDLLGGIPLQGGLRKLTEIYEPGDQIIYIPIHYQILYPSYYWQNSPETGLSMQLFMKLYGADINQIEVAYRRLNDANAALVKTNIPYESNGKIIMLNWNMSDNTVDRLHAYCRDVRNSTFTIVYKQIDMYIAICK